MLSNYEWELLKRVVEDHPHRKTFFRDELHYLRKDARGRHWVMEYLQENPSRTLEVLEEAWDARNELSTKSAAAWDEKSKVFEYLFSFGTIKEVTKTSAEDDRLFGYYGSVSPHKKDKLIIAYVCISDEGKYSPKIRHVDMESFENGYYSNGELRFIMSSIPQENLPRFLNSSSEELRKFAEEILEKGDGLVENRFINRSDKALRKYYVLDLLHARYRKFLRSLDIFILDILRLIATRFSRELSENKVEFMPKNNPCEVELPSGKKLYFNLVSDDNTGRYLEVQDVKDRYNRYDLTRFAKEVC